MLIKTIGSTLAYIGALPSGIQSRMTDCKSFVFPRHLFARHDCGTRLKAVSTGCFFSNESHIVDQNSYRQFSKIILTTGVVVDEQGGKEKVEIAIAAQSEIPIISAKVAFVVIEEYLGSRNVGARLEIGRKEIKNMEVIDQRSPAGSRPVIALPPVQPDLTSAQLKIDAVALPPPAETPAGFPRGVFAGIVTDCQSMAITADCFSGKPPKQVMILSGKIGAEQETIGLAVATDDAELVKKNKCANVVLAQRGNENNVAVKLEKIRVASVIDLKEEKAPMAASEKAPPAMPALPAPVTIDVAVASPSETSVTAPTPGLAIQPPQPEPKKTDAVMAQKPVATRTKIRRVARQGEDAIDQMMRKPEKTGRRSEVRPDIDYKFLVWVNRYIIAGRTERNWDLNALIAAHSDFLPRFASGNLLISEVEAAMGQLFKWPVVPERMARKKAQHRNSPQLGGQAAEIDLVMKKYGITETHARGLIKQFPNDAEARDKAAMGWFGWRPVARNPR